MLMLLVRLITPSRPAGAASDQLKLHPLIRERLLLRLPALHFSTGQMPDSVRRYSRYQPQARFPFKRNRLRWQAANHGCHCFDRAFLLAGAGVCCVKISRKKRKPTDQWGVPQCGLYNVKF